jgi:hypothetical protein
MTDVVARTAILECHSVQMADQPTSVIDDFKKQVNVLLLRLRNSLPEEDQFKVFQV